MADPLFGFAVPTECPEVPAELLQPRNTWKDKHAYDAKARKLAALFRENFKKYEAQASTRSARRRDPGRPAGATSV